MEKREIICFFGRRERYEEIKAIIGEQSVHYIYPETPCDTIHEDALIFIDEDALQDFEQWISQWIGRMPDTVLIVKDREPEGFHELYDAVISWEHIEEAKKYLQCLYMFRAEEWGHDIGLRIKELSEDGQRETEHIEDRTLQDHIHGCRICRAAFMKGLREARDIRAMLVHALHGMHGDASSL